VNPKDRKFYYDELMGEECQCGRPKRKRRSFCYKCYSSLPHHMQRDLYQLIGQGYEEAYDEAVRWLND